MELSDFSQNDHLYKYQSGHKMELEKDHSYAIVSFKCFLTVSISLLKSLTPSFIARTFYPNTLQ